MFALPANSSLIRFRLSFYCGY